MTKQSQLLPFTFPLSLLFQDESAGGWWKKIFIEILVQLFMVLYLFLPVQVRACLHGGRGPQVGQVTHLGGVTRLSI